MNILFTLFVFCALCLNAIAQAPQKMSYQAVVRDAGGNLVTNKQVGMRITILEGTLPGIAVYQETQAPTTNANGLVTIEIGGGAGFDAINWGNGVHFLKTETDPWGSTNHDYTISGTSQLLSVPYALFAKDVQNGTKPAGVSGNVQFNNSGAFGGDANFHWDNVNKRLGIGIASPGAMLQVNNWNNSRQIAVNEWSDISASTAGYGLFASNAYLSNELNTLHFSNSHASLGASGIIFNYPYWHTATIFVNEPSVGSVKGQAFTPNAIASFRAGEVNVNNNKITNVADPVNARDAATKAYVDALIHQLSKIGTIVADADGNIYPTVRIGSQIWMAENLKTTKFNDGTAIPLVTDGAAWQTLMTPGYCWYNNDQGTYGNTYGALYNWYSVITGKLCPAGWHIPSDAEWTVLSNFLGGESVAGGKMKETGNTHWQNPNTGATNESGFTGLPGGTQFYGGAFAFIGSSGYWWSSTEYSTSSALLRALDFSYAGVVRRDAGLNKTEGFSIRCVRDN